MKKLLVAFAAIAAVLGAKAENVLPGECAPVVCRLSFDGKTADFDFTPSAEARSLYVAYGPADANDDLDGWAHYDKVADVPAGAETLSNVALPAAFNAENGVLRAVLKATTTTLSASGYVHPTDLLAQWDGVENVALGAAHDSTASAPHELRGGIETTLTGTMAAGAQYFTLGSGYLHFTSKEIIDAINAGHATVELVLEPNGALVHNGGLFCAGNTSRAYWIYQQNTGFIAALSYHAAMSGDFCQIYPSGQSAYQPGAGFPCPRTFTTVLGTTRELSFFTDNGVRVSLNTCTGNKYESTSPKNLCRHTTDCTDSNCYIGVLPGNWLASSYKATAKVYSIRVYNRVLTEDEIERNGKIDRARFNEVALNEFSAPVYFPTPLTVKGVTREAGVPTVATLVFAGSAKARDLYLVLAHRDQGEQQEGWTQKRLVKEIAAGEMAAEVAFTADERAQFVAGDGFRFFLTEPDYTADDYAATEDLVLQFDGIENAGFGIHDENARCPCDLRSSREIVTAAALQAQPDSFVIGGSNGYMKFDLPELMERVNAGDATVELVLAPNGAAANHNGGIFCLGGANATIQRGFWLYQHNTTTGTGRGQFMFSAVTYHGANGSYDGLWTGPWSDKTAYTWSCLLDSESNGSSISKNGVIEKSFSRFAVELTDSTCYVGILPGTYIGSDYRANAKVHSIRVYNRKLTPEEITRNVTVDGQRFRGEVVPQAFSAFERGIRRGLIIVVQ